MEYPCNECYIKVGSKCVHRNSCDSLMMYRRELSMLKDIVSEEEYDRMPCQVQGNYWYCVKCGRYHAKTNRITCEEDYNAKY